jgi:uncharacterized protein
VIKNKTRNSLIVNKVYKLKGINKTIGLISKDRLRAIVLETHFGIHTFLLKFPIDVLVLDNNNQVVALKKALKPYRLFIWNCRYNIVIELPEGSIEKSNTQIGDLIELNL